MKHTPGPWVVTQGKWISSHSGNTVAIGASANGNHVDGHLASSGVDDTTLDANARLIAAAPELLAAATDALQTFYAMPLREDYNWHARQEKTLEDAIAKATGE